jgi:hypothetical protein
MCSRDDLTVSDSAGKHLEDDCRVVICGTVLDFACTDGDKSQAMISAAGVWARLEKRTIRMQEYKFQ